MGLSSNELRPSHFVGFYLKRHGYRVIAVNPRETEVLGRRAINGSPIDVPVDVVDVFRAPQFVPELPGKRSVGAKALWLQFGVIPEGAEIAKGGLQVVMDRCMKVEHARSVGRMHWYGLNTGVSARRNTPTESTRRC